MNETYTVKRGDTLYGISNQYGVSVTELAELNGIKGSNLQIGTVLKIPGKAGTNPNNMFMYTVKAGDTIYSIARKYNVTPQSIIDLNYFKTPILQIGQVIRIPETYTKEEDMIMPNYINYTVVKGDSLYKISEKYNVSVDTIIKDNSLPSTMLSIGQNLKIRVPSDSSAFVEECFGPDYTPEEEEVTYQIYTVGKGDSLYKIANKFNTTVNEIMKLNNLNSTLLNIGDKLKIPGTASSSTVTYTVKKGDSLYAIARTFNTTVDEIKRKNNLTSNALSIGQILKI